MLPSNSRDVNGQNVLVLQDLKRELAVRMFRIKHTLGLAGGGAAVG